MGDFGVARSLDFTLALAQTQIGSDKKICFSSGSPPHPSLFNQRRHFSIGTPYYVAPEIVNAQKYNAKVDMWSLGVIIYELCALCKPFQAKDMGGLMKAIRLSDPKPLDSSGYSKEPRDCVSLLLSKDPLKRCAPLPNPRHLYLLPHNKPSTCSPRSCSPVSLQLLFIIYHPLPGRRRRSYCSSHCSSSRQTPSAPS